MGLHHKAQSNSMLFKHNISKTVNITFQNEEDGHGVLGKHRPKESTCCQTAFKERETHDKNHMGRRTLRGTSHNGDRGVNEDLRVKSRSSNIHEAEARKDISRKRNTLWWETFQFYSFMSEFISGSKNK